MSLDSVPPYPGPSRRGGAYAAQPPTTPSEKFSYAAEDASSTHTGTPSWTDSAAAGSQAPHSAPPPHAAHPAHPAQHAMNPNLDPIPDADESDHGSQYQDVESRPQSRAASWAGSQPRAPSRRESQDPNAGGAAFIPEDPYDPFAHQDGVRFDEPAAGAYPIPGHNQAVATGLLQQPRPALVRRSSSRMADRGHPFSVEHRATNAGMHNGPEGHPADEEEAFFDPTWQDFMQEEPLEMPFFDHVVQRYGEFGPLEKAQLAMRQFLSFCLTFGVLSLVLVLSIFNSMNPFVKRPPRSRADREYETRITGERGSGRVQYYCEFWGYECVEYEIVTDAGWILKAHRISDPRRRDGPGYPVICQHGILCNSSHFVVCEERSLAFWLVDQGYDVWLTNIRSGFGAGHTHYSRDDPRFWAFGLKELALDLQEVVEFICEATGFARVAYIGHSQGSGSMYAALSPGLVPELGNRLSVFIALGPSVFAGPVLRRFPFSLMRRFRSRQWWSLVFGVKVYIPAIGLFHRVLPTWMFGHIAAALFEFMFGFHIALTPKRQIPKLFRTAAVSTSSELLYWYMAAWAHRGCIFDPRLETPWFPPTFPPHSMFYGSVDMLVIGRPLAERLLTYERNVDVIHCVELDGYEHLDFLFAHDAWHVVYPGIQDSIEATIDDDDYPIEMESRMEELGPTYASDESAPVPMRSVPSGMSKRASRDAYFQSDYDRSSPPPSFRKMPEPYVDRTTYDYDYRDDGGDYYDDRYRHDNGPYRHDDQRSMRRGPSYEDRDRYPPEDDRYSYGPSHDGAYHSNESAYRY